VAGSLPSAYLVTRWFAGRDVRQVGSGNVGGMNVIRNVGPLPGLLGGALDVAKAVTVVWAATALSDTTWVPAAAGALVCVGHNWMLFLRFAGGKGLATSLATLLYLWAPVVPWLLGSLVLLALILRDTMTAVFGAYILLPLIAWLVAGPVAGAASAVIAVAVCSKLVPDVRAFSRGQRRLV